jgi:Zn-dependent protease
MNLNLSLGKWLGIPVILHWSWLLIFVFLLISNPVMAPVYAGLFLLVLLHEFGHAMAGRYLRFPTHSITLYPFGGIAQMQIPSEPREAFVAMAGPAVNVALVPVFMALPQYSFCQLLGYYNMALLIFNLVPAFPMDGGRVLRSILVVVFRDHYRGTLIAVRVGQAICVVLGVIGIATGMFMLVIIALFIFMAASGELAATNPIHSAVVSARQSVGRKGREIEESAQALRDIQRRIDRLK